MKTTVFTNGCFDLLHAGHVRLLTYARSLGDRLVVGLNTDEAVRTLKGADRPIIPFCERWEMLAALTSVDVVMAIELDATAAIGSIRPSVYVKGPGNQDCLEARLMRDMGKAVVVPEWPVGISTSSILERIRR